jgi:hypothetical protein
MRGPEPSTIHQQESVMTKPFGEDLWKNLQAVSFGQDGGIDAPVRADGKDGIRIGADAVADTSSEERPDPPKHGRIAALRRLRRS